MSLSQFNIKLIDKHDSSSRLGDAAELFVGSDLFKQGHSAFIVHIKLLFDIIAVINPKFLNDYSNGLKRVQVRSTHIDSNSFGMQHKAKRKDSGFSDRAFIRYNINDCDYFAFVNMMRYKVAYYRTDELLDKEINDGFTLRKSITPDFTTHSNIVPMLDEIDYKDKRILRNKNSVISEFFGGDVNATKIL